MGTIVDATVKCVVTSLRLVSASGVAENFENDESSNESNSDIEGNVQVGNDSRHQLRLKRKFQELKLSPDKHPHFTHGALYYRHVLDENSPLLRSQIKERIRDVGGWPSDLNNPANIHDCLSKDIFDIVSRWSPTLPVRLRASLSHSPFALCCLPECHIQGDFKLYGRLSFQNALFQTNRHLRWLAVCKVGLCV